MSNRKLSHAVRTALITAGALSAGLYGAASAAQERLDEIVVTGSRIARDDFSATSPLTVLTSRNILEAGQLDLGAILNRQLAMSTGGFGQSSTLSGGGASSIDMRYLGSDRVLTLINGRRVARFADALQNESFDLSLIPLAMIERVEILRDGASAIYGADAVSGVVNIILKDNYEGTQITAAGGVTGEGDAEEYALQGVFGTTGEQGNLTMSLETKFRDNVPQRDRDWALPTISFLRSDVVSTGSGAHPGGTFSFSDGSRWCTQPKVFGGDEVTNVFGTANCPGTAPVDPNRLIGRYDYGLVQDIINEEKQLNFSSIGTLNLGEQVEGFTEVMFSRRETESILDGNPIFGGSGSPSFPGGWTAPADNPYNPFPGESANVTIRPTSTVGAREQSFDANMIRYVVGLRGEDLFDKLDWEVSYTDAKVTGNTRTDATFNLRRANTISDPTQCAADPLCAAALKPDSLGALDVYRPGNWSESEIAYIRQISNTDSEFDVENIQAFVSGELYELPAGSLGFAFGAEYREESAEFNPDPVTASGESVANQTFATRGKFDSTEVFTEVDIPILSDAEFAKDLSLNLQGRWFDYSTFGDDTVYKVGLNYAPIESMRLRATIGTSFRAPTLVDSFSGGTVSFDFIDDPCNAWDTSGNATLIANCGPGGANLPPGFQQSAPQLPVLAGGDLADGVADLGPEEGDNWTVGVVLQPTALPNLRATVDYWSIEVSNFIDSPDVETEIVVPCYASANLSAPECNLFSRNPDTGNLTNLVRSVFNRSGDPTESRGIDWRITYADWAVGPGMLTLDHEGTYQLEFKSPGVTVGPGEVDFGSPFSIPEFRLNFGADYAYGDWNFGWRGRYIDGLDAINSFADGNNPIGYDTVDSHFEHDLTVAWNVRDDLRVFAGVNNVTDEEPPYVFSTGNNTDTGLYGSAVLGRFFYARVTMQFGKM